jgi:hypothetical protein
MTALTPDEQTSHARLGETIAVPIQAFPGASLKTRGTAM